MDLKTYCVPDNLRWQNTFVKAYDAKLDDNSLRTVLEYSIPLPPSEEEILFAKYGIPESERTAFYNQLLTALQQNFKCAALLANSNVPSILRYYKIEQNREKNGTYYIWAETEHIVPFTSRNMNGFISKIDALNAFFRLILVLRDIHNTEEKIVLRSLDMREVFVNDDNRILLGGFYYASGKGLPSPPPFLPDHSEVIPQEIIGGAEGTPGMDMAILATYVWNLFSGIPMDTKVPKWHTMYPVYASEELVDILELGKSGDEANIAAFRRKFGDYRKMIAKAPEGLEEIPVYEAARLEYRSEYR